MESMAIDSFKQCCGSGPIFTGSGLKIRIRIRILLSVTRCLDQVRKLQIAYLPTLFKTSSNTQN